MIDEKMKRDMEAFMKRSKESADITAKVQNAKSLHELKECLIDIVNFVEKKENYKSTIREYLIEIILKTSASYLKPSPAQNKNVVFIPPEDAPVMMIPACFSLTDDNDLFFDGLRKFIKQCELYVEPIEDIITEEEMNLVLDNAQSKFKALDVIAPVKPLKIISLNNSHIKHNSECGYTNSGKNDEAVIFVFHLRKIMPMCDRFFVFAHELGHALHFALTKNIRVIPNGFDGFNESLDVKLNTLAEKQEAFADVAASAILNSKGLKNHLPPLSEDMLKSFDKYIKEIIAMEGALFEPENPEIS